MPSPTLEAVRATGGLSLTAISRLERRFGEALRHTPAARVNLRLAVRYLVAELAEQGTPSEVIRGFVKFLADHHPERDDLDRTSMVTGQRESDRVTGQMMGWVDELYPI
jgi:hypothetical protein